MDEDGIFQGNPTNWDDPWGFCDRNCPVHESAGWGKDKTVKMTLQYKYDDQALWTGLELYGLLSSCFLLYSFILTAVISAVGRRIIRPPSPYELFLAVDFQVYVFIFIF